MCTQARIVKELHTATLLPVNAARPYPKRMLLRLLEAERQCLQRDRYRFQMLPSIAERQRYRPISSALLALSGLSLLSLTQISSLAHVDAGAADAEHFRRQVYVCMRTYKMFGIWNSATGLQGRIYCRYDTSLST